MKELYDEAIKLIEKENGSHLAARDIFLKIVDFLKICLADAPAPEINHMTVVYSSLLAYIYKDLGKLHISMKKEARGRKYFHDAIKLLESHGVLPETVLPRMMAIAGLSDCMMATERELALENLIISREIYDQFKSTGQTPYTVEDLFGYAKGEQDVIRSCQIFEKVHTSTLHLLSLAEKGSRSLIHLSSALRRRLENNDYDPIRWAFDAAKLAKFLVSCRDMHTARHVLASTTKILDDYKPKMITKDMSEEQANLRREEFRNCYANLNRWWAAYCYELLSVGRIPWQPAPESKNVIVDLTLKMDWIRGERKEIDYKLTPEEFAKWRAECGDLVFATLDTRVLEEQISDQYSLEKEDAEKVFRFAVEKLNNAREYFRSDTHPKYYAEIVWLISSEFTCMLADYEEDEAQKCKIYKKGMNKLEELVEMSNPKLRDVKEKALFVLGSIYSKMLDIKMRRVGKGKKSDGDINKINKLCVKGIKHFQAYIDLIHQVRRNIRFLV